MKISVILPTYKRDILLCQTISDVLRQEYPDFEIIVLDQTPVHDAATSRFLEEKKNALRYYRIEKPSVVSACNHGVKYATGEILLFIDDDISIPNNNLLQCHARNYGNQEIGGVAGKILDAENPVEGRYHPGSLDWNWGFLSTRCDHNTRTETVSAQGANMSFRKTVVLDVGGFDENYGGNAFRWETDFCYRLKKKGYQTIYDPDAWVLHHFNSPGGNQNVNLFGRSEHSHEWYYHFFRNSFYFHLKNIGGVSFVRFFWKLYRGHVFNRIYLREGFSFLRARHVVFFCGLRDAARASRASLVQT